MDLHQIPFSFIKEGETICRSLNVENRSLKAHARNLHISLQYEASLKTDGGPQAKGPSETWVHVEMECLLLSEHRELEERSTCIDLQEGDWVEKVGLEAAFFSVDGLLLKQKTTLIRLRERRGIPFGSSAAADGNVNLVEGYCS